MGFNVNEQTLAPYASGKWNVSEESAKEVLDIILWGLEDRPDVERKAIETEAEELTLRALNDKYNLGIREEIVLESERS